MTKNKSIFKQIMENLSSKSFSNKKVIIRVDFNVPLNENFKVLDGTRIDAAKETILYVIKNGGSCVLLSHLGRPKGKEPKYSLSHIVYFVEQILEKPVKFCEDCIGEKAEKAVAKLAQGEIVLMENVRFYEEETKGDMEFAKKLSLLGDYYVNDAFGSAHRAHASTTGIANFFDGKKCPGMLLKKEINSIERVLKKGETPILAIIGGAKISSKITIIENLLDRIDYLIIGGGMVYTFVKALGGEIGDSLFEEAFCGYSLEILSSAKKKGVEVVLPDDVMIGNKFSIKAEAKKCSVFEIPVGWQGLDAGPKTIEKIEKIVTKSKTILWNGPIGVFELELFANGTKRLAEQIGRSTKKGAFSLVGGGDLVSAVKQFGLSNAMSYISTGGGAMLESLEGKKLPGIIALMK